MRTGMTSVRLLYPKRLLQGAVLRVHNCAPRRLTNWKRARTQLSFSGAVCVRARWHVFTLRSRPISPQAVLFTQAQSLSPMLSLSHWE